MTLNNNQETVTIHVAERQLELMLMALDELLDETLTNRDLFPRDRLQKGYEIQKAIDTLEAATNRLNGSNGQKPIGTTQPQ